MAIRNAKSVDGTEKFVSNAVGGRSDPIPKDDAERGTEDNDVSDKDRVTWARTAHITLDFKEIASLYSSHATSNRSIGLHFMKEW